MPDHNFVTETKAQHITHRVPWDKLNSKWRGYKDDTRHLSQFGTPACAWKSQNCKVYEFHILQFACMHTLCLRYDRYSSWGMTAWVQDAPATHQLVYYCLTWTVRFLGNIPFQTCDNYRYFDIGYLKLRGGTSKSTLWWWSWWLPAWSKS